MSEGLTAGHRSRTERYCEFRSGGTSLCEIHKMSRFLLKKTERLAYASNKVGHVLVLLNLTHLRRKIEQELPFFTPPPEGSLKTKERHSRSARDEGGQFN